MCGHAPVRGILRSNKGKCADYFKLIVEVSDEELPHLWPDLL